MFKCPRCSQEYPSYNSLSKHTRSAYKLSGEQLYREYHNIIDIPTCKCGCGEPTKWRVERGYGEYANGHNSRGESNPMFGKSHSVEAKKSISSKRKEKFANGEYRIWQTEDTEHSRKMRALIGEKSKKENNPERAKKISLALAGVPKSPEHKKNSRIGIKKAWENEDLRDAARDRILTRFLNKKQISPSLLEITFKNILNSLRIEHCTQKEVGKRLYDFHLLNTNILIEVDGDFHHANPQKWPNGPIYESQKASKKNDMAKNKIANDEGYTLLRFWETDINTRPAWVVAQILTTINSQTHPSEHFSICI